MDVENGNIRDSDGWYYATNGEKHGPIERAKLDNLYANGMIGRETIVWRSGMGVRMPLNKTDIWGDMLWRKLTFVIMKQ